jgi:hypothetical protein
MIDREPGLAGRRTLTRGIEAARASLPEWEGHGALSIRTFTPNFKGKIDKISFELATNRWMGPRKRGREFLQSSVRVGPEVSPEDFIRYLKCKLSKYVDASGSSSTRA